MSAGGHWKGLIEYRIVPLLLLGPSMLISAQSVLATSAVPSWFGRYSSWLFLFNVVLVATMLCAVFSVWRQMFRTALGLIMCLIVLTYLMMANNSLRVDRLAVVSVIALVGLGLSWCWVSFLSRTERWSPKMSGLVLAAGVSLTIFALADGGVAFVLGPQRLGDVAFSPADFRTPINLKRIDPQSIVVIGDSMVWGQGVAAEEAFPQVLQSLLRKSDTAATVYNLGVVGVGLETYLAVLQQLPHKQRAIVCYYMNDIPERQRPGLKLRQALMAMGRGSASMRLAADAIGLRIYPDVDRYTQSIVRDYDRSDPTFAARWNQVESFLSSIAFEARRDADKQPLLIVIPIMWEFQSYPLRDVHTRIAALARSRRFIVLDLLPEFERRFPHGKSYLVGPNDNHFNTEVHAYIAELISKALALDPP